MYINLLLLIVFGAVVATGAKAGIWTNVIRLFNVITAALLAVNYFEPVADWLDSLDKSFTYLTDFLALWGVFAVGAGVLRALTDAISKIKVKFKKQIDNGVGAFFACWTGWVMVMFTAMSLHVAPVARDFLDSKQEPKSSMFLGFFAPDRQWLGFVRKESLGALARSVAHKEGGKLSAAAPNEFDPRGEFIFKYGQRRADFAKQADSRVNVGR
jgi:uncharacterized membrane protein required for colicin V production